MSQLYRIGISSSKIPESTWVLHQFLNVSLGVKSHLGIWVVFSKIHCTLMLLNTAKIISHNPVIGPNPGTSVLPLESGGRLKNDTVKLIIDMFLRLWIRSMYTSKGFDKIKNRFNYRFNELHKNRANGHYYLTTLLLNT